MKVGIASKNKDLADKLTGRSPHLPTLLGGVAEHHALVLYTVYKVSGEMWVRIPGGEIDHLTCCCI
jgi:hypothetical protein